MGKGIRIAAAMGLAAGVIGTIQHARGGGSIQDKMGRVVEAMVGINPVAGDLTFRPANMVFTIPVIGGAALSIVASKTGLNRVTPKGLNI